MANLKVLALYYTQSGQLEEIVNHFTLPFTEAGMSVEKVNIRPEKDFPFPWKSEQFFEAMPESVLGQTVPLKPFELKESHYDLILFAYQPWFLSLSIPANSMLQHPTIKAVLKGSPVVTLIGARNMWLNAQEKTKKILANSGAKLVGNVVLVDQHSNLASAVTILYWMLTGKKDKYLGIFPKPGVSEEDIAHNYQFGKMVCDHLQDHSLNDLQKELVAQKAVVVESDLLFIEERAPRLFSIWANLITKRKNRKPWLIAFKYYLLIALFIVAPIVLLVNRLLFRVFFLSRIKRKKKYYQGLEN